MGKSSLDLSSTTNVGKKKQNEWNGFRKKKKIVWSWLNKPMRLKDTSIDSPERFTYKRYKHQVLRGEKKNKMKMKTNEETIFW